MSTALQLDDMLRVQTDVAEGIASCDLFAPVRVVEYRKKRLESELDFIGFMSEQSAAKSVGVGIMVELPVFTVPSPNISGPQKLMVVSVRVLEDPKVNMTPGVGTEVPAETWANLVLDFLHHWIPRGSVSITADDAAITPLPEYKTLVAYSVNVRLPRFRSGFDRVGTPTGAQVAGTVTISPSPANPLSTIYYTTDGSFPAHKGRVPQSTSTLYAAPFAAAAGTEVQWAAYEDGLFPSNVGRLLVE